MNGMNVRTEPKRRLSTEELMLSNCSVGEDSWESLGLQGDPTSQRQRKSILNIHWKDWCWSWSSSSLATWCDKSSYWKKPWFWERLRAGGEGGDREWDGWMVSSNWWIWVWLNQHWKAVNDSKAWCATVNRISKNGTWLSNWTTITTVYNYWNLYGILDPLFS